MSEKVFGGFATTTDGQHVTLTSKEAGLLWEAAKKEKEQRAVDMPDTTLALAQINRAKNRLSDLGWRDGIYCPKDGNEFACVQFGSSGIFSGFYEGEWPEGRVYVCDYLVHPGELMWKLKEELSSDERKCLKECMREERQAHEREMQMYAQMNQMEETNHPPNNKKGN